MKTVRFCLRVMALTVVSLSLLLPLNLAVHAAELAGKTIAAVNISGNTHVEAKDIMTVIKVKPGDTFEQEKIQQDMQSIYELGLFLDVAVDFQTIPEGVEVTYKVMENPRWSKIEFVGNQAVTTEKLTSMIMLQEGQVTDMRTLSKNLQDIRQYYHNEGYILAKVSDVSTTPEGVLTININEGILEDIVIKGHAKTKEYVIRRELYQLEKGKAFNINKVRRSVQRVYNLGYFEDVNMKLVPGLEPNGMVLELTVVEQKTGTFSIGAGYSKADGMVGIVGIGDKNFRGTGDKLNLQLELGGDGSDGNNYEVSYVRPWLDSKQTSLGFSVYDMTKRYNDYEDGERRSTYDRNRKGWDVTLGRPSSEYLQHYVTFKQREDSYVEHVSGTDFSKNGEYLANNFGKTNSLSLSRIYDSRDNVFSPTEGTRLALTAEFAGKAFGGDFNFNKYTLEDRNYWKVGRDHVVALRLTAGYADGKMPDSGRFAVGGAETLRGYEDDQFKGNKMLAASLEYRFPVASKVHGVVFSDIGNAWSSEGYKLDDLKASAGVGLRLNTPIGPIRLDVARGEEGTKTHFSFGGQF